MGNLFTFVLTYLDGTAERGFVAANSAEEAEAKVCSRSMMVKDVAITFGYKYDVDLCNDLGDVVFASPDPKYN